MALGVVQKASIQGEELGMHLEFCRELGVLGSSECPKVEQIPEEDIRDLERIIHEASKEKRAIAAKKETGMGDDHEHEQTTSNKKKNHNRTIITDKWEVFPDDDLISWVSTGYTDASAAAAAEYKNPFAASSNLMPYVEPALLPDLISL